MRRCLVLIAASQIALCAHAVAQSAAEIAKTMAGGWEMSNADRDRTCIVTLRADPARTGFKLDLDRNCPTAIPATRDIDAWTISNETIRLIDPRGRTVFEFGEVESGMYEAERAGEGLYFFQSQAAAATEFKTAEQMAGDWTIQRGNAPICQITLAGNAAIGQPEGELALGIRPGCDAAVTRFNPLSWKMDQGELVLIGPGGQTWRFAADETQAAIWKRIPETAQPITMVKK